jgi:alkylation response protein AidB-like acyl-CoA dehydrogenase
MPSQYVHLRNLHFLLFEVLEADQLHQQAYYQDYDKEAFRMTLDTARQLSDQYLYPIYREMDRNKAYFKDGKVHVHPKLRDAILALGEGGWIASYFKAESGGMQMPFVLSSAAEYIFYCANGNAAAHAFLTRGAANLIEHFGKEELKEKYLPSMLSGEWQGTMALTEPQAGSSLSDLSSSATPLKDGSYKIRGQKIYISGGDHEAVENVIHLMLARVEGAPPGTKGISLFVVPKFREENGALVFNDVQTAGIYGKMGQKGYVAAHLMMGEQDNCIGYLVGQEHKGLSYMFQMMNEARIATGILSSGNATAAYYASLQYAKERSQGRHPGEKDPTQPPVPIIEHADVKRMLLQQKAVTEGSISLLLECSYLQDVVMVSEGEEKQRAHLLLELLTPIAKSYPAEMGFLAVNNGMQVLGGAGYTDDFPLEQLLRDIRVNSIYEGTTTIHGMDLLGRKVMLEKGEAMKIFMLEIQKAMRAAKPYKELQAYAGELGESAQHLHKTTMSLIEMAMKKDPRYFLADATLYLELFGIITIAWQWLKQATVAAYALKNDGPQTEQFYQNKLNCIRYYYAYELPKIAALIGRLGDPDKFTVELDGNTFD